MSWSTAAAITKKWRKRERISQPRLAHEVGVSVSTISRLENGTDDDPPNTDFGTLYALAERMGSSTGASLLRELGYFDEASQLEGATEPARTTADRSEAETTTRRSLSYGGKPISREDEERIEEQILEQRVLVELREIRESLRRIEKALRVNEG